MTEENTLTDKKMPSFLHEAQKFGKSTGEIVVDDLEKAIQDINKIRKTEAAKLIRQAEEADLPTLELAIYCQDCREIVPSTLKTIRKKQRKVCGKCGSVKLAEGSEKGLKSYYRLEERERK